jgi:hypothetical protein
MIEGSGAGFVFVTKTDPDGDPGAQKYMDQIRMLIRNTDFYQGGYSLGT